MSKLWKIFTRKAQKEVATPASAAVAQPQAPEIPEAVTRKIETLEAEIAELKKEMAELRESAGLGDWPEFPPGKSCEIPKKRK